MPAFWVEVCFSAKLVLKFLQRPTGEVLQVGKINQLPGQGGCKPVEIKNKFWQDLIRFELARTARTTNCVWVKNWSSSNTFELLQGVQTIVFQKFFAVSNAFELLQGVTSILARNFGKSWYIWTFLARTTSCLWTENLSRFITFELQGLQTFFFSRIVAVFYYVCTTKDCKVFFSQIFQQVLIHFTFSCKD